MESKSKRNKNIRKKSIAFYDEPVLKSVKNSQKFDFYTYPEEILSIKKINRLDAMNFCPYFVHIAEKNCVNS